MAWLPMNQRKKTLKYFYTQWLPRHWLKMTGLFVFLPLEDFIIKSYLLNNISLKAVQNDQRCTKLSITILLLLRESSTLKMCIKFFSTFSTVNIRRAKLTSPHILSTYNIKVFYLNVKQQSSFVIFNRLKYLVLLLGVHLLSHFLQHSRN